MASDESLSSDQETHRVRFRPPGLSPEERVGTVTEQHYNPTLDHTMYCIEDDEGETYEVSASAILAPEETGL